MKDIKGYEGRYAVTVDGEVWTFVRGKGRPLKGKVNTDGYIEVSLHKLGVRRLRYVHRLVAETFIPNPLNMPQVNHINFNRSDNKVENLEWCTAEQNIQHSIDAGRPTPIGGKGENNQSAVLSDAQVIEMREMRKDGARYKELAKRYGVCLSTVNQILGRRIWKHL